VALIRTDVSEEYFAPIIRVTRISEIETLAATSIRSTLRHPDNGGDIFSETLLLTKVTQCHIPEDGIPQNSHRCENLKSYIATSISISKVK
jgi:hypothetical protein